MTTNPLTLYPTNQHIDKSWIEVALTFSKDSRLIFGTPLASRHITWHDTHNYKQTE